MATTLNERDEDVLRLLRYAMRTRDPEAFRRVAQIIDKRSAYEAAIADLLKWAPEADDPDPDDPDEPAPAPAPAAPETPA